MAKPFEIKFRKLDPAVDPMTESYISDLVASGMPPEAVRPDRTLDPVVLRAHGWDLVGGKILSHVEVRDG